MTVKIQVLGLKETVNYLNKKVEKAKTGEQIGLTKAALFVQGEVKSSIAGQRAEPTSVDTGRFLNSIDISVGKVDAIVFSDVPYAKHLEYGTSKIKARPHFRNSKARNQDKVIEILSKEIKSI